MKLSRPSPALVVASIALFIALGGTSVAAVSFARNAGKVDGKDAVFSGASLGQAAGNLVATERRGANRGKLPNKFLGNVPATSTFGRAFEVVDNATLAPVPIGGAAGIGTLTATCGDQSAAAGVEDPRTVLTFVDQSGEAINIARRVGNGEGAVGPIANGTGASLAIPASDTFFFHVERRGVNVLVNGVVRQDGRGTPAASCLVYGTVLQIQ